MGSTEGAGMLEVSLIIGSTDQVVITDIIGADITLGDLTIIVVVDTHEQFMDNFYTTSLEVDQIYGVGWGGGWGHIY